MDNKTIVLTLYGKGKTFNDFTITIFDGRSYERTIKEYCTNINSIELKDDNWIYAKIIDENEKIKIEKPWNYTDFDILGTLDDRTIQKIILQVNNYDLKLALKSARKETLKAILRNKSKRSAKMLIEDMRDMFYTSPEQINEARRKIVDIMKQMDNKGDIDILSFILDK
jgi:flagellar motor switch protein FliG